MPPIVTGAEIDRPAVRVFACATDPSLFPQCQKGVTDGHVEGPADGTQVPAVGTKRVITRRIGGASRSAISELTHIDPARQRRPGCLLQRRRRAQPRRRPAAPVQAGLTAWMRSTVPALSRSVATTWNPAACTRGSWRRVKCSPAARIVMRSSSHWAP